MTALIVSLLFAFLAPCLSELSSYTSFQFTPHGEAKEYIVSEGVDKPYTVISQVFYSQAFPLLPGQMLFSNPRQTPVPMPDGKYAIVGIIGDIARENGKGNYTAASLSEVYDHHWIIEDLNHRNLLCPHGPNYVFGIGAESRNSPVNFPKGHGYVVNDAEDEWGANIHLLRTDSGKDLIGDDPWTASKECAECFYSPAGTKGKECTPERNGTFQCCGDNCYDGSCSCPTKPNTPQIANNYALRYVLNYTRDLDAIEPVGVGVFTTPSCATFYEVYENNEEPETLSSTTFDIQVDSELMLAIGHLHTGGINISFSVNDKLVCTSFPSYGTKADEPGNELGHLVSMSTCYNADVNGGKGFKVKKGDKLRVDGWYWVGTEDKRIAPTPGGTHLNVMAYMYTAYKVDGGDLKKAITQTDGYLAPTAECMNSVKRYCGADLGFPDQCAKCARVHDLASAGCGDDEIKGACLHMNALGRAPSSSGMPRRPVPVVV
jgi:hypothetical protein